MAEIWTRRRHARARRGLGDGAGAAGLDAREVLAAALLQDADEVDHRIGALDRGRDRIGIAQIGLHGMDLADHAERLQEAGEIGPAHRDAHAIAALHQRAHDMAADEAGAAEDRDELLAGR